MNKKFYALVTSQTDLLKNESLEEIFRERTNQKISQGKKSNFWILNSLELLKKLNMNNRFESTNYYSLINKNNLNNYFTIFLTNDIYTQDWLELRLGYFEDLNSNIKIENNSYKSNGIKFSFELNSKEFNTILNLESDIIDPNIVKDSLNIIDAI
jgi:hypothetical protein